LFSRRSGNNVPTKENKVTEDEDDHGMKELEYRGITVKEVIWVFPLFFGLFPTICACTNIERKCRSKVLLRPW
jgi:hypothetical protein